MTEKKTSDMLVRAVPLDVWERVARLCRRKGMKRRDFIERALALYEAAESGDGKDAKSEKDRLAKLRVDQIRETLIGYEGALKLKKTIEKIRKNRGEMGDREAQMSLFLELKKMDEDLDKIIADYIPKHEIPDEISAREKMGLPFEYWVELVTREEWEKTKAENEAKGRLPDKEMSESPRISEEMKAEWEKISEELNKKLMSIDENKMTEEAVQTDSLSQEETGAEKEKGSMRKTVSKTEGHDSVNGEQEQQNEKKREIETTVFGRGFEGWDGE